MKRYLAVLTMLLIVPLALAARAPSSGSSASIRLPAVAHLPFVARVSIATPTGLRTPTPTVTATPRPTATATGLPMGLTIIRSFPAPSGTQPNGLAWDGRYLWMSSYMENGGIYQLDPLDGSVVNVYTPPAAQHSGYGGLTFDGDYLWEADAYGGGIYQLRMSDASVVSTIPCPEDRVEDLAWDGTHLWAAGRQSSKIYRIRSSDGVVTAVLEPPTQFGNNGLAYFLDTLWLSHEGELLRISPTDGQVLARLEHSIPRPDGLAWAGLRLWVASFSEARIYLCDIRQ